MDEPIKLEPSNLREVWDTIKPYLEQMRRDWPELGTWRVEDVYAEVLREQAVIYMTEDGFAVCTLETDKYSGRTDLFIWIAYAYDNNRGGMLQKYLPSFIEVAKHLGCSGVATASNHPALAQFQGMTPVYTQYRAAIDEST